MPTQTPNRCCRNNPLYNIRRYDPIGRTIWIRDYFAGAIEQEAGAIAVVCRLAVDDDRIFVCGPLVSDGRFKWNCVCYSVNGSLLWRRRFGTAGGATDVAIANDRRYVIIETPASQTIIGSRDYNPSGLEVCEFDRDGNAVETRVEDVDPMGPRFLAANPLEQYIFRGSDFATGLVTFGWPVPLVATAAIYQPANDDFIVAMKIHAGEAATPDLQIINRVSVPKPIDSGGGIIIWTWASGGNPAWGIGDAPEPENDGRVWQIPIEMSAATDGGAFCACNAATPYLLYPAFDSDPEVLAQGSLVRIDADGNPVWSRGIATQRCVAADAERLYSAALVGSESHPTIMRWSQDGDFIWGHKHNAINDIAIVGDEGIVTAGIRQKYGMGEINWITEGSIED